MYETQSYAFILQRMLDRVPDDVDKRQGSIIYDALAPAASELAAIYIALDANLR
ncbi:MAG: Baseplate family protein, partial [Paenibacillus sp.]|nr:Baseplate family protein [Paenibacillus sp.]